MKFLLQVASDIKEEYCESFITQKFTFQFRNKKHKHNPDLTYFFVC